MSPGGAQALGSVSRPESPNVLSGGAGAHAPGASGWRGDLPEVSAALRLSGLQVGYVTPTLPEGLPHPGGRIPEKINERFLYVHVAATISLSGASLQAPGVPAPHMISSLCSALMRQWGD